MKEVEEENIQDEFAPENIWDVKEDDISPLSLADQWNNLFHIIAKITNPQNGKI